MAMKRFPDRPSNDHPQGHHSWLSALGMDSSVKHVGPATDVQKVFCDIGDWTFCDISDFWVRKLVSAI
jgi:hypothetical protein